MRAAGAILLLVGIGLALESALLLAGRGRPRRGPRPAFVIAGPYRRIRNPLLAGCLLALGALALCLRSSWSLVVALGAAAASHLWVVRFEEPRLRTRFGAAYEAYLRRVPRWFPRSLRDDDATM